VDGGLLVVHRVLILADLLLVKKLDFDVAFLHDGLHYRFFAIYSSHLVYSNRVDRSIAVKQSRMKNLGW